MEISSSLSYIDSTSANSSKVFVGNVPFQCTNEEFFNCFRHYEGFISADIINRQNSVNSRGFGFITFKNSIFAGKFLDENPQISIKNRLLRFTKYHLNDSEYITKTIESTNLFIKNIPDNYTSDMLKKLFESKTKNIGLCYINTDIMTGEKKNTGIVEILDYDIYDELVTNGKITDSNNYTLLLNKYKNNIKIKKPTKSTKFINTSYF